MGKRFREDTLFDAAEVIEAQAGIFTMIRYFNDVKLCQTKGQGFGISLVVVAGQLLTPFVGIMAKEGGELFHED